MPTREPGPARGRPPRRALAALALLGAFVVGCERGIVEVNDPDIVDPGEIQGPEAVPSVVNGIVGDFTLAFDDYVRYSGMFTDEFILSGTFPTRVEVDFRNIQIANGSITTELYEPLHVARFAADDGIRFLEELAGDPDADPALVGEALAIAQYYSAYTRLLLAEMYCQSILGRLPEEAAPLLPDERMREALALFQEAEASAAAAGLADFESAALVGQARAHLWLREFAAAAAAAAQVPSNLIFRSEYSSNDPTQNNDVYCASYGDTNCGWTLRWTVGAGNSPDRRLEIWPYFDEWVALGLINPNPNPSVFAPQNTSVPVALQLIYGAGNAPPTQVGQSAPIILASGFEADMIEAEALLRQGNAGAAQALVNARITTGDNPHLAAFSSVAFSGDLSSDLEQLARARAAGLWLTGERLGTLRRFLADGVDLFPGPARGLGETHPGLDTAFPLVQQEIDNNPNVSNACPSGPPWS